MILKSKIAIITFPEFNVSVRRKKVLCLVNRAIRISSIVYLPTYEILKI